MWNYDDDNGGLALGLILWDNNDFRSICTDPGTVTDGQTVTLAYTVQGTFVGIKVAYMHMCAQGYDFPRINEVRCGSLGNTVSSKLDIMAGIFVHEYT